MNLTFDEASHLYKLDGKEIPSVTQILQGAGLVDYSMLDEATRNFAMGRGSAVHLATELYDQNDLDMDSLDPCLLPYLSAWQQFRKDTGFKPNIIEGVVANILYEYAGTFDRTGFLNNQRIIIDIKSNDIPWWTALQLAAYEKCLPDYYARYAIALRKDGTYRLKPFRNPLDWENFVAALRVYEMRKEHKLIKETE